MKRSPKKGHQGRGGERDQESYLNIRGLEVDEEAVADEQPDADSGSEPQETQQGAQESHVGCPLQIQEHGEWKKTYKTPPFRCPMPGSPKLASSSSNPDQEKEGRKVGRAGRGEKGDPKRFTFPSVDLLGCPH